MSRQIFIYGRWMQQQPCQQQQGSSLMQAPPARSATLLTEAPAAPPPPDNEEARAARWAEFEKKAEAVYKLLSQTYPGTYPDNGVKFKVQRFKTDLLFPGDHVNSEAVDPVDKLNNTVALNGRWIDKMMRDFPNDYHIDVATAVAHGARHLTQSWPSWVSNKSETSPVHEELERQATADVKAIRPQVTSVWTQTRR